MSRGELVPMAALMGLLIGSLLTVVAERVPQGGSVAPPSRCGNCGLRIEPLVLELATASLFVIFALKFHDDGVLPAFCILAATLVVQSWIDLNTQTLPRPITLWVQGWVRLHWPLRRWSMASQNAFGWQRSGRASPWR